MAVRLVYPDRKIVAVCGDGGFLMSVHDLETAVRLQLDLVILVLRDNGYGMIKWKQEGMGFADYGLDFGNPDFVKLAECHGANGHRVSKADEFLPLLKQCIDTPGIHIIEVPIDYSENTNELDKRLQEKIQSLQEKNGTIKLDDNRPWKLDEKLSTEKIELESFNFTKNGITQAVGVRIKK